MNVRGTILLTNKSIKKMKAIVIGATGATGREIVNLLLKDSNFSNVSCFVRTTPNIKHEKLTIHKINFSKISEYKNLIAADVIFSALGTTVKNAGSKKQQYLVDYTYQYEFAKIASENGVGLFSLVSSSGANENSPFFYPKIKGSLEEAVKKLNFNKIQIFQPPVLIRQSDLIRSGEKSVIKALRIFNKLGILKSQKPLAVENLASKMISEVLLKNQDRTKTYGPKDLQ